MSDFRPIDRDTDYLLPPSVDDWLPGRGFGVVPSEAAARHPGLWLRHQRGAGVQRQAAALANAGQPADLPDELGKPEALLADNGYFNAANVEACQAAGIDPLIALGRDAHHPRLAERFAAAPEDPTPVGAMAHRLRTPQGRALYALRHQTPEPVSGTINSVLGFRHFLLRGLDALWRRNWFPGVAAPRSVRTNEPSADLNQEPGPTG